MWVTPTARAKCNNKRCQICSHYNNSAITGAISLKLGMLVGTHQAMHSYVLRLWCYCTCARVEGASKAQSYQCRKCKCRKCHLRQPIHGTLFTQSYQCRSTAKRKCRGYSASKGKLLIAIAKPPHAVPSDWLIFNYQHGGAAVNRFVYIG